MISSAVYAQDTGAGSGGVKSESKDAKSASKLEVQSSEHIVELVQRHYDKALTYSAHFDQVLETIDGITKKSSGTVWFKKPGMMRWDYEQPQQRYLISNETYFWSWEPKYRQYCQQSVEHSQLPTALTFLSGKGKIADDFEHKIVGSFGTILKLELTPKKPSSAYKKLIFHVVLPLGSIAAVDMYDGADNRNTLKFSDTEFNAPLDSSLFSFTPPKGAKQLCQ